MAYERCLNNIDKRKCWACGHAVDVFVDFVMLSMTCHRCCNQTFWEDLDLLKNASVSDPKSDIQILAHFHSHSYSRSFCWRVTRVRLSCSYVLFLRGLLEPALKKTLPGSENIEMVVHLS